VGIAVFFPVDVEDGTLLCFGQVNFRDHATSASAAAGFDGG
jgi:hypothetical protein